MTNLPEGWKLVPTKNKNKVLFRLVKVKDIEEAFQSVNEVSEPILAFQKRKEISISINDDFLTISLNDLGNEKIDDFIAIAQSINNILPV